MDLKSWKEGKKAELNFWCGWLAAKGKAYETSRPLSDRFNFMIGDKKKVTIANLGAGPVCLIGDRRRDVKVKVVSSDLLANKYRKLLKELNLQPINTVKKQDMTKLTYKNNTFDIVYCDNALDHSQDPYKAVTEMVRVCKPGGWIYLRHIAHEGQRHHYRGIHQWNIDATENADCIFWNSNQGPQTDTFLLSEIYPGFTTTFKLIPKGAIVTSFVQKK
ncbi:MAG: class I SAM-dependent methyltransferase [Candidatus Microgenomates bacterium]|jgi:SAM-dependent methyltransferase